ncbi:protein transport protein SEC31-like [Gossypium hirsutum]|uniref:Protein transport protein SEC31-like n=1 Tax=Gossypium hirsutum TaxID=3635 RepID=A0ABM3AVZ4_GOSHI|nr:protein transport protein SEC31-like [Gossypium hirsutum]
MDLEEFDDHHKIDLRLLGTKWPLYWSGYKEMWENRYEYQPTREPIIVPELACVPEYMPWFRIHGKPYLLMPEERQRQIRVGRERRGPLNPRRQDEQGSPSTRLRHSPGSSSAAMQSPGPTRASRHSPDTVIQPMIPTQPPFQTMPGAFPIPYMYPNPYMYPFPSPMAGWSQMPGSAPFPVTPSGPSMYRPAGHEGSQEGPSGSSPFYQSLATYGFQTPSPFVMQTPPHTLFFEGGSSSQV